MMTSSENYLYSILLTHVYQLQVFRDFRNLVFRTALIDSFQLFTSWRKTKFAMKSFLSIFPSSVL